MLAFSSLSFANADLVTASTFFRASLQHHTVTEWVWLEGAPEDHLVHHYLPCSKQDLLLLQVAQNHDQVGFEYLQG